ncbi:uncharacterized protein KD926_004058 [Aspergillus affinis]|uniref:uncharacterized protein n=1 Tax=Aspergillus affinis TaxID=1070780 RepID=UPI0022FDE5DD|nr:uncharacterized protein KD926_004058 [Aspergillus affinis]KAI9046220.1 hypothetical protein KD926_004058 [Aspergillus affinis]
MALDRHPTGDLALGLSIAMMIMVFISLPLRLFARLQIKGRAWCLDDALILVAAAAFYAEQTVFLLGILGNGSSGGSDLTEMTPAQIDYYFKHLFIQEHLFAVCITFVKLSILVLYRRIFPIYSFARLTWIPTVMSIIWYIVAAFILIFQCHPIRAAWTMALKLTTAKCMKAGNILVGTGIANIVIDLIILALPVYMVRKSGLRTAKKASITGIFLLGGFVCVASAIRSYHCWKTDHGFTDSTTMSLNWATIELAMALICASLPTYPPLFAKVRRKLGRSSERRSTPSSGGGSILTGGSEITGSKHLSSTYDYDKLIYQPGTSFQPAGRTARLDAHPSNSYELVPRGSAFFPSTLPASPPNSQHRSDRLPPALSIDYVLLLDRIGLSDPNLLPSDLCEGEINIKMADEFAQTRGGDDLFDDEIIPVVAEEQAPPAVPVAEETVEVAPIEPQAQPARVDTPSRSRGGAAGGERRGRGRGKGRGRRGSRNSSQRRAEGPVSRPKSVDATSQPENNNVEDSTPDASGENAEQRSNNEDNNASAAGADAPKVPAVRGDRSATGGIKKPKLTEEELSRRIAAAKENAAKKAAAHARAEADQASFLEREKVAEVKRKQERQNRRVMDNERERNRLRKLQALNGREWDSEKQDEPDSGRGGRGRFRGMHGGVSGYARRDFEGAQADEPPHHDNNPNYRGRGRGGRGGRGRGNGRGGRANGPVDGSAPEHKPTSSPPVINNDNDFPALPGSDKKESADVTTPAVATNPAVEAAKIETSISPISATGASWAEQVESAD